MNLDNLFGKEDQLGAIAELAEITKKQLSARATRLKENNTDHRPSADIKPAVKSKEVKKEIRPTLEQRLTQATQEELVDEDGYIDYHETPVQGPEDSVGSKLTGFTTQMRDGGRSPGSKVYARLAATGLPESKSVASNTLEESINLELLDLIQKIVTATQDQDQDIAALDSESSPVVDLKVQMIDPEGPGATGFHNLGQPIDDMIAWEGPENNLGDNVRDTGDICQAGAVALADAATDLQQLREFVEKDQQERSGLRNYLARVIQRARSKFPKAADDNEALIAYLSKGLEDTDDVNNRQEKLIQTQQQRIQQLDGEVDTVETENDQLEQMIQHLEDEIRNTAQMQAQRSDAEKRLRDVGQRQQASISKDRGNIADLERRVANAEKMHVGRTGTADQSRVDQLQKQIDQLNAKNGRDTADNARIDLVSKQVEELAKQHRDQSPKTAEDLKKVEANIQELMKAQDLTNNQTEFLKSLIKIVDDNLHAYQGVDISKPDPFRFDESGADYSQKNKSSNIVIEAEDKREKQNQEHWQTRSNTEDLNAEAKEQRCYELLFPIIKARLQKNPQFFDQYQNSEIDKAIDEYLHKSLKSIMTRHRTVRYVTTPAFYTDAERGVFAILSANEKGFGDPGDRFAESAKQGSRQKNKANNFVIETAKGREKQRWKYWQNRTPKDISSPQAQEDVIHAQVFDELLEKLKATPQIFDQYRSLAVEEAIDIYIDQHIQEILAKRNLFPDFVGSSEFYRTAPSRILGILNASEKGSGDPGDRFAESRVRRVDAYITEVYEPVKLTRKGNK